MNIKILTLKNKNCTIGKLSYGDFQCLTLELPWKNNQTNVSCIPAGVYKAGFYDSPSKGKVILLEDVPDRTYIEIHSGNYTRQIQGCILIGESLRYLNNDDTLDITNSKYTLKKLSKLLPEKFTIEIERHDHGMV